MFRIFSANGNMQVMKYSVFHVLKIICNALSASFFLSYTVFHLLKNVRRQKYLIKTIDDSTRLISHIFKQKLLIFR